MKELVKSVAPIIISKMKKLVANRIKQVHTDSIQCNHRIKDIASIVQLISDQNKSNQSGRNPVDIMQGHNSDEGQPKNGQLQKERSSSINQAHHSPGQPKYRTSSDNHTYKNDDFTSVSSQSPGKQATPTDHDDQLQLNMSPSNGQYPSSPAYQQRPKSIAIPKMQEVMEHEDEDLMSGPSER